MQKLFGILAKWITAFPLTDALHHTAHREVEQNASLPLSQATFTQRGTSMDFL